MQSPDDLPPTEYHLGFHDEGGAVILDAEAYTADQMRAYRAECVAQERERCAKVCEGLSNDWHQHDGKYALEDAANKIRAGHTTS